MGVRIPQRQKGASTGAGIAECLPDVGWGFIVAWGLSTVFTDVFSASGSANLGPFWFSSMVGAPAGLLLCFFAPSLKRKAAYSLTLLTAVSAMTLGLILLALSLQSSAGAAEMQVAGGLVSSMGTAVFTVLWGSHYARLDAARIERMAACSLTVAFGCYALVLVLPRVAAALFVGCLPFLSCACLMALESAPSRTLAPLPTAANHAAGKLGRLNLAGFARLGLGIVGATSVVSVFWSWASAGAIPVPPTAFSACVLSGSLVAVIIMAYLAKYARSLNLGMLYRWLLPIVSAAIALLAFRSTPLNVFATFLVFAAQALLNLITFIYFAELSQRTGASPVKVFGLGRFFLEAGFLVGLLLQPAANVLAQATGSYQGALCVLLAVFVALAMISIANQDRLAFTLDADDEPAPQTADARTGETASPSNSPRPDGPVLDDGTRPADEQGLCNAPASPSGADAFTEACAAASDQFGLTKREREILPYLAQGYSLPYIRNELYVSQSTIDTHVRHIYKKMGLHSKEELITYVRLRSKQQ